MSEDAFRTLGLEPTATPDDVRRARRELAKRAHPDVGGDPAVMRALNDAAAAALRVLAERSAPAPTTQAPSTDTSARSGESPRRGGDAEPARRDAPSFTVEALPAEAFEALLIAAAVLGELDDDDPPYALDVLLSEPFACWCHVSVVPDAGASTISLTLSPEPGRPLPAVETVRDAWISELNSLDWSDLR